MERKSLTDIFSTEIASLIEKNGRYLIKHNLKEKVLSIFDNVEIKKSGLGLRYLILKIADLSLIPVKHIGRVVNTLYHLYGDDDDGRGKFSELDICELNNRDDVWNGRSWLQTERYLQPAMIRCDDNEGLKLFIMNV